MYLDEYCGQRGFRSFEGHRGVSQLETIMRDVCGYGSYNTLEMFFEDNPGAIEAVLNFITNARVQEWEDNVNEQLELFDGEKE